jgi:hypothetical protein
MNTSFTFFDTFDFNNTIGSLAVVAGGGGFVVLNLSIFQPF